MKTKLSHSQVSRYQMCGESYRLHYIAKIRPTVTSAALVFGTAIDEALNELLVGKSGKPAEEVFEATFTMQKLNGASIFIPTCTDLVYANSDFDGDLLVEDDYKYIAEMSEKKIIPGFDNNLEAFADLRDKKKKYGLATFSVANLRFYNLMNWLCLRRKGKLMIAAYRKKVIPKINKVHVVQKYIELSNQDSDKIIGYVDLVADVEGHGTVILDNKTSSMDYEEDSVITSPQLSLYVHALEPEFKTRKAGYIVMKKQVIKNKVKICSVCNHDGSGKLHKTCDNKVDGKRCGGEWNITVDPEVYIQFIVDEIPEKTEEIVLENVDVINEGIKKEIFPRNLNSCSNWYGSPCPYMGLCYKGDMHGLVDQNKKKLDK